MERVSPSKNTPVAGQRFGKLVIVQRVHDKKTKTANLKVQVRVQCDCGNRITMPYYYLVRVHSKPREDCGQCGERSLSAIHWYTHRSWYMMNMRCTNDKHIMWKHYGGRGVKVCDEWSWDREDGKGFANFLEDMGERPHGLSIDRVNNNMGYKKSNCRWATAAEQRANQGQGPIEDNPEFLASIGIGLGKGGEE